MLLTGFTLNSLRIDPPLILAPMSGVTNSAFRRLIRLENPGALGLMVTEFISIEGLTRYNKQSLRMMSHYQEERPLAVQIFGFDIDRMVTAAKMVQDAGADAVDINCGCPVPKVVRRGGGCELMRQPEHLAKLLRAVRGAVKIPLTMKMRSGWDENSRNAVEIARLAEAEGLDMITVHPRTRVQLYRGEADWEFMRRVVEAVKIPVAGSGDVFCLRSAAERAASGVKALMVGRGALANPWIFSELAASLRNTVYTPPPAHETVRVMRRYMALLQEEMSEKGVSGKIKQFASQITRRVRGAVDARRRICRTQSLSELNAVLDSWEAELKERCLVFCDSFAAAEDEQPAGVDLV
jgi:tRNA-dihydrouridine synthase B